MRFNKLQLTAVIKAGKIMTLTDGRLDKKEMALLLNEIRSFGIDSSEVRQFLELGDEMESSVMLAILSSLDIDQKKYVTGFLAALMTCDGDVDDSELKFWKMTSTLSGFPTMSIKEALDFYTAN